MCLHSCLHYMTCSYIILSSVACLTLQYFSTLSHKWHQFWKNFMKMKCMWWFSVHVLSKTFLILRRIQWDIIISVHTSSCNTPVIVRYSSNLNFLDKILKKYSNMKFYENMSSRSLDLLCRWTDIHDKASRCFSQFCERSQKGSKTILCKIGWLFHMCFLEKNL